jgi:transcription termination/antitermination protein NusG
MSMSDYDETQPETLSDPGPSAFDAAVAALGTSSTNAGPDDSAETVDAVDAVVDLDGSDDVEPDSSDDVDDSDSEMLGDAEVIDIVVDAPRVESPYDRPGGWYIVHTYAGYENKVKQNLASRLRSMNVEDKIYEVVIPMEEVIEFRGGKKVHTQKKLFPGYLYIRMDLDDESWYVVRNTPGVTGFVGGGAKPVPLMRKAVEDVLGVPKIDEEGAVTTEKKVRPRLEFEVGEQVRVVTGPFADFNGVINDIDVDRSRFKVLVNIFGRETPVELEFGDVAKL